ncbi:MAG: hypothetical protein UH080_09010 [Ruminococcus sp.]|nr:hypothetical protein [Ruminococcus sp.]
MKVKFSWIPFIPIALGMAGFKTLATFMADENGIFCGLNFIETSYAVIGAGLVLFVLCVLLNMIDRKTAPVYSAAKNIPAAIFSVMSAVMVMAFSVLSVYNSVDNNESYWMHLICSGFSLFASIALVFMSRVHFTGIAPVSNVSALYIFPSLWACSELVSCFLDATKVSVSATDMTSLFCFIFLSLYLFSHAMVVSKIKGRNPVKASFIYGMPAAALTLTAGVYYITTGLTDGMSGMLLIRGVMFMSLALYTISFVAELTKGIMTKDEVEIIDEMPEEGVSEEAEYVKTESYSDIAVSESYDKKAEYSSIPTKDINDFIMGYDKEEEVPVEYLTDEEKIRSEEITGGFFFGTEIGEPAQPSASEAEIKNEVIAEPVVEPKVVKTAVTPETKKKTVDRMSEIDMLIAELESKK